VHVCCDSTSSVHNMTMLLFQSNMMPSSDLTKIRSTRSSLRHLYHVSGCYEFACLCCNGLSSMCSVVLCSMHVCI